ncbi:MAG TPA: hypothetical protein PKV16_07165 [Caldisericia bacterium]|nr:hypothetical protein [Caldisericia bacterium]HPF49548.1 hypothetical protein [Caldisericia bacterium]HPI84158.1 hypothetical protein [Caldisericia bacterium]HPQ93547.1 hypothetical protein [Caldisericia bacterium]HRV75447.1 hypothetical protein [Caldisericia bacterium]
MRRGLLSTVIRVIRWLDEYSEDIKQRKELQERRLQNRIKMQEEKLNPKKKINPSKRWLQSVVHKKK